MTDLEFDVVLGVLHPDAGSVRAQAASIAHCTVSQRVDDLAARMASADLAIGAGGTTIFERACLGLPSILLVTADNQAAQVDAFAEAGLALALRPQPGWPQQLVAILRALRTQPALLRSMSARLSALTDGSGADRVARELVAPRLHLRPARIEDAPEILAWRNHPDTRRHARDPREIGRDEHERWMQQTLARADRCLLIAEAQDEAVGVLRFDLHGSAAEISIYLVPGHAGRGLGTALLRSAEAWLRQAHPMVERIDATVLVGNAASSAAFLKAGYRPEAGVLRRQLRGEAQPVALDATP